MANHYGTLEKADTYFSERLNTSIWEMSIVSDRTKAMLMATKAIDRLNYANVKTAELQFPRGDDTVVPVEIEYACYEIALALLDGVDVDQEAQTIGVMSETYSGVRSTYDGDYVNHHIRAGIPSIIAWDYLKPFLRDPRLLNVSRVN